MDLDAFLAQHAGEWARLDVLAQRRRLTGAEADELITLYRRCATHLSLIQSRTPDPVLSVRLSALLARARAAAVGGTHDRGWAALGRGITIDFPVAVYRAWRWWAGVAAASVLVMGAIMLWLRAHPDRVGRLLPSTQVRELVSNRFADYYSQDPAQSFAAHVWANNAIVAAVSLFLGVTVIGTVAVLAQNTVGVGVVGGIMLAAGKGEVFFGLVLPHGLLELTAIFIAGGVGLRTGWAWIAPGRLPRSESLAAAGRVAAVVAVGLVAVLLVSGVIEAFVTPSGLPTWARIGIGVLAETVFLSYVLVLGRRGAAAGATGDLAPDEREHVLPVA